MKTRPLSAVRKNETPLVPWPALGAKLEAEGKWSELISLLPPDIRENKKWQSLSYRWQAAFARALVFLGEASLAETVLAELQTTLHNGSSDDETRIIYLLAHSAVLRRAKIWDRGERYCRDAGVRARELGLLHLECDAKFGEALSLAGEGRWFLALDIFQSLRRDPRPLSAYRRGLASLNEAWALWDTGQWELMRDVFNSVPAPYRHKITLYLDVLEGRAVNLRHWIFHGPQSALPPSELEQVLMILTEWQTVTGGSTVPSTAWLDRELRALESTAQGMTREKVLACQKLLRGEELNWPEQNKSNPWLFIELAFLATLSKAKRSPEAALRLYEKKLIPVLKEYRMKTPLVPTLKNLQRPETAWERQLACFFSEVSPIATDAAAVCLLIEEGFIHRKDSGFRLDLRKSSASLDLLKALQGHRGFRIRKNELHLRITKTNYHPEKHEARLQKLLKRLGTKLEAGLGVRPWNATGDQSIELLTDIFFSEKRR